MSEQTGGSIPLHSVVASGLGVAVTLAATLAGALIATDERHDGADVVTGAFDISTPAPGRSVLVPHHLVDYFFPWDAARNSTIIVLATVVEVREARWSGPEHMHIASLGQLPNETIYRPLTIEPIRVYKGPPSANPRVALYGGTANGETIAYGDQVEVGPGQQVLLFLRPAGNGGPTNLGDLKLLVALYPVLKSDVPMAGIGTNARPLADVIRDALATSPPERRRYDPG